MTGAPPLPEGFALALDPGVRRIDEGTALIGGSPLRILRLTRAGAGLLDRWAAGAPVSTSSTGEQRLARRLLDGGVVHPRPAGAPTPYEPADVAVVIPIRGEPTGLAATLTAVGRARPGAVVVVDDGSSPRSAAAIADLAAAHGADLVRVPASEGPGRARMRGLATVDLPVLAFVDADVVPADGWLTGLLAHLADPTVGAVAPRIVADPPPTLPAPLAAYERARSPLDLGPGEAPVAPRSRVPYVPTACLVVRRDAVEAVGGFDTDLRHGEDVDLVWRLVAAGRRVRFAPSVTATHPARPSVAAWLAQRFRYGRSAAPLAARHGAAVAPLTVSGWSAMGWGLVGAGAPALGAGLMAATTAALAPKLAGLARPMAEAGRLAGLGNLFAGRQVAVALRRAWPPALVAMLAWRRSRPAAVAALLVPPLLARREAGVTSPGPVAWVALSLADDLAYALGLWAGVLQTGEWRALQPAFSGRFPPPEPAV